MSVEDPIVFHIAVPADLREDLTESIGAAANDAGNADWVMSVVDADEVASELQFDPLTAAVIVGKFVVLTGTTRFVGDGLAALVKKARARIPAGPAPITVMLPDGSVEVLDLTDEKATAAVVERIRSSGG